MIMSRRLLFLMVRERRNVICRMAFVIGEATVVLTPTVLTAVIRLFVVIRVFMLMARAMMLVKGVGTLLGPVGPVCLVVTTDDPIDLLCIYIRCTRLPTAVSIGCSLCLLVLLTVRRSTSRAPLCLTGMLRLTLGLSLRRNRWAASIERLEQLLAVLRQLPAGLGKSSWPSALWGLDVRVVVLVLESLALMGCAWCLVRVPAWNGLG